MSPEQVAALKLAQGDRVYRWWDAGFKMDPQPLTVVRVNRTTVTVTTDEGSTFRAPFAQIEGRVDWPEDVRA